MEQVFNNGKVTLLMKKSILWIFVLQVRVPPDFADITNRLNRFYILTGTRTRIKFENAALFLQLGLPSTSIRHENGAFYNAASNWRNLKTAAFRFRVGTVNTLKTELFG